MRRHKGKKMGKCFLCGSTENLTREHVVPVNVVSNGGIYLGTQEGIVYNANWINRVIEKICKGLFAYHHPNINSMNLNYEINRIRLTKDLNNMLAPLKKKSIGNDAFIYWRGISNADTQVSIWVFLFYLHTMFSVETKPIA